jgi:hypothetical protein
MTTHDPTQSRGGAYFMSYADANQWYYLPTDPERRKWRGPYRNHAAMLAAVADELGPDAHETETRVRPAFLSVG